ncbi:fungal-specific transcription factor domain-containing protein [Penicillium desertorum]|uniref:Fungal-specific transcription factor domain-containing protein n=1 Tax=Penicillium desertorum TaxID=1303715 RepID=A0A9W9X0A7_9EURO|nr:fungal-specific transcription factor domain-containing protein [Penicillium desertorum]
MSSGNGRIIAHRHAYNEALPTEALIFEGTAYNLNDESRTDLVPEQPIIPSLDHTLYLINMVNFRYGQLYHLFDKGYFIRSLHDYYSNDRRSRDTFGKSFLQTRSQERKPPGIKYFAKDIQLLPDHNRLYSSPLVSTEILCCIAIFYQTLDCRSPAYNYVGQAMRMAMSHGIYTYIPVGDLGLHVVKRCRKTWWTIYILDRLPLSSGPPRKTITLGIYIKLYRRVTEINNILTDELRETFPLYLNRTDSGIPRTSACLYLFY